MVKLHTIEREREADLNKAEHPLPTPTLYQYANPDAEPVDFVT
jgi:hypothetical protein